MAWIADYCAGTISKADFEQLGKWLEDAPGRREELKKYLRTHRAALELTLVDHLDAPAAWRRLLKSLVPGRHGRWRRHGWTAAAAVVAGICLSAWFVFETQREEKREEYPVAALPGTFKATLSLPGGESIALDRHVTLAPPDNSPAVEERPIALPLETRESGEEHLLSVPRGGEYQLTLADGTRVWLNSDTRLRFSFPFAKEAREIYLEGEAYFEVQREEGRPFIVHAGPGSVNVTGTTFNVSAYPGNRNMVTTLVRGSVEVNVAGDVIPLVPGTQASWKEGVFEVREVDVLPFTSWVKGIFEFENTSLRDILNYLARWYNVTFEFSDEEVAGLRFTGGAKKYRPLEEFTRVIERSCEVKFSMKESVIHVSGDN
jgi:ferric-dicitrate binding protein FerR (iron transport regulator)